MLSILLTIMEVNIVNFMELFATSITILDEMIHIQVIITIIKVFKNSF